VNEDFGLVSEFQGALTIRLKVVSRMRRERMARRKQAVAEAKAAAGLKAARELAAAAQDDPDTHHEPTGREVAETLEAFRNELPRLSEAEQETFAEIVRLFLGGRLPHAEWMRAVRAVTALAAVRGPRGSIATPCSPRPPRSGQASSSKPKAPA
jgi:hypothetical protein